jgi:hypothetical protein
MKARVCEGASQEWVPIITFHALGNVGEHEGVNPHIPKWTPILGVKVSMDSRIFKGRLQGSNSLDWKVLYIIENLLERRCIKWVRMIHLDTWNISYGQKKGQESNYQFDSRPLKVKNRPDLFACISLKNFRRVLHLFFQTSSLSEVCKKSYGPWKSRESQFQKIWDSQLGSPGTKWHLCASFMAKHKIL